jgi:hypothetical protein
MTEILATVISQKGGLLENQAIAAFNVFHNLTA